MIEILDDGYLILPPQLKIDRLEYQLKKANEIVKAVAYIGVDAGYGRYELNDSHIVAARDYLNKFCN